MSKKKQYYSFLSILNKRISKIKDVSDYVLAFYYLIDMLEEVEDIKRVLESEYQMRETANAIDPLHDDYKNADEVANRAWKIVNIAFKDKKEKELFAEATCSLPPLTIMNLAFDYLKKLLKDGESVVYSVWCCLWDSGLIMHFKDIDNYKETWKKILTHDKEKLLTSYLRHFPVSRQEAIETIRMYANLEIKITQDYVEEKVNQYVAQKKRSYLGFNIRLFSAGKDSRGRAWFASKHFKSEGLRTSIKIYICNFAKLPTEERLQKRIYKYFKDNPNRLEELKNLNELMYFEVKNMMVAQDKRSAIKESSMNLLLEQLNDLSIQHSKIKNFLVYRNRYYFTMEELALSILSSSIQLISGFQDLINKDNYISSCLLLKMQLDNFIHFNAYNIVKNPYTFAVQLVLEKQNINKIKSKTNRLLSDRFLLNEYFKLYPENKTWVNNAYKLVFDFVHLSQRHSSLLKTADKLESVNYLFLGKSFQKDIKIRIVEYFKQATEQILNVVESWMTYRETLSVSVGDLIEQGFLIHELDES